MALADYVSRAAARGIIVSLVLEQCICVNRCRMVIVNKELVGESDGVEFIVPDLPIGEFFERTISDLLKMRGDGLWMKDVSSGDSMTYAELGVNLRRIASALRKRGFSTGDIVLIMAANYIQVPLMFFAVWKAGGSSACLTLNLFASDIEHRARENGVKYVLTDELRAPRVVEALSGVESVREIFVIGEAAGCTPISTLLEDDALSCPDNLEIDLESPAWLMYSSGTTGTPKGIVQNHRTINALLQNFTATNMQGVKLLFINLMINNGGMAMALLGAISRCELYTLSKLTDESLLIGIDTVKPQVVSAFPSQIAWMCKHPRLDDYDVSSVNTLVTVGSSLNPTYERNIFDKLPNLFFLNIFYGMSETGIISGNSPKVYEIAGIDKQKAIERHIIGSAGKVHPYCRVKIVDEETGQKVGPGEIGEIHVKSPYIMKGYLDKPKETAEMIVDGWARTGDKGYYDDNENLFIIGRYKELIKYRMAHVVPTNIEKHLLTHPSVADAGVVGLPDDVDGELPVAFVVLSQPATEQELVNYTNERVVEEEKLRGGIRFIDKIPRNDLGKIMRPQLSKLL